METGQTEAVVRQSAGGILRRSELFRAAGDEAIVELAAAMIERSWKADEELFSAGDPSDGFYVVLEGVVRLGLTTSSGGELILRDAFTGDVFGEIGSLDGGPRSAGARVRTGDAKTAFLSSSRLRTILERHAPLLFDITRQLCLRLRETTDQLEGIALYPLKQRLARFIHAQGRSRGRAQAGRMTVSIPVSQTAIAALLGARRPKTNVAITELEKAGVIERRGALFIYDETALAREASGRFHGPA